MLLYHMLKHDVMLKHGVMVIAHYMHVVTRRS